MTAEDIIKNMGFSINDYEIYPFLKKYMDKLTEWLNKNNPSYNQLEKIALIMLFVNYLF